MSDAETQSQKAAKEMVLRFPIVAPPVPDTNVGGGSYYVGVKQFRISLNKLAFEAEMGRYDAVVHLRCGEDWTGFRGGACYKFLDDKGNVVYAMAGDTYEMSGKQILGAASEADKIETKIIPLDVLTAIYSVEIIPVRTEGPAWEQHRKIVGDLEKEAEIVRDELRKIGVTGGEIAAAIKAL